jgi:hypothetical protein
MIDEPVRLDNLPQGLAFMTFCPPDGVSCGSRKLVTRGGFLSPSLDGGLPVLELFNPSRRR